MIDLTIDDPTKAGLAAEVLSREVAADERAAREAVARSLAELGATIDPARIVLVPGRADALARAIAARCAPHDELVTLTPCAPRVDVIARLAGVHVAHVPLVLGARPELDVAAIYEAITERTRAIVLSAPHEPTGVVLTADTHDALLALGVPLIVDETLARYPLDAPAERVATVLARPAETLTLSIGGYELAPSVELAWIAVAGPDDEVEDTLATLDELASARGAVSSLVLAAAPGLLASAAGARAAVAARIRRNLDVLRARFEVPRVEGGWLACLRGHEDAGARVCSGAFYELPEGWIVISLLTEPASFDAGLDALDQVARRAR